MKIAAHPHLIVSLLLGTFVLLANPASAQQRRQADAQDFGMGIDMGALLRSAEGGDLESQFQVGLRLAIGQGVGRNPAEGAKWLRKAAEGGHVKAMHVLGSLYDEGLGVTESAETAAEWYQKAADQDMPEAMLALGLFYQNGRGVKKDPEKATALAKKGADLGHSPSQTFYASKLLQGDGAKKNPAKAAVWFLKAAQQDHPYAQRQLAYLYYTGNGVPLDYERCLAWYARAAKLSQDPWAQNDLAWFLATCPDAKFHRATEAVEIAKNAVMTLENDAGQQRHEMIDTMAAALARNGQFGEALVWQKRSLKLLEDDKDLSPEERAKLKAEFESRVALYQAKKAYTEKAATPSEASEPLFNDDVLSAQPRRRAVPENRDDEVLPQGEKKTRKGNAT